LREKLDPSSSPTLKLEMAGRVEARSELPSPSQHMYHLAEYAG